MNDRQRQLSDQILAVQNLQVYQISRHTRATAFIQADNKLNTDDASYIRPLYAANTTLLDLQHSHERITAHAATTHERLVRDRIATAVTSFGRIPTARAAETIAVSIADTVRNLLASEIQRLQASEHLFAVFNEVDQRGQRGERMEEKAEESARDTADNGHRDGDLDEMLRTILATPALRASAERMNRVLEATAREGSTQGKLTDVLRVLKWVMEEVTEMNTELLQMLENAVEQDDEEGDDLLDDTF